MKTIQIDSKIHIAGAEGKNYSCSTIGFKELKGLDFEIYSEIEGIIGNILFEGQAKAPPPSVHDIEVLKAEKKNTTLWTDMFTYKVKVFSSEHAKQIKNILFNKELVLCVVKEGEYYPAVNYLDQINIQDIYKIIGGYLDAFFTI